MKLKYRIEFLDEAVEFLNGQDYKAREKIYYNLKKNLKSQMIINSLKN